MSAEAKFCKLYEEMYDFCEENDLGDPFVGGRGKEIHMAGKLGHKVSETFSGADAYDEEGGCEYKSTISPQWRIRYTVSIQSTWKKQLDYLRHEKIVKYKNHYHAKYEGGKVVELWKMSGEDVLKLLRPKLKRAYDNLKKSDMNKACPTLRAELCGQEITSHGERII